MSGLLKKDLYVSEKTSRLLLVLALILSLIPKMETFGNTYAMMLAFMMPMNAVAYDERCKWDRYAAMLPYRTEQIVWGKYMLSYIYTVIAEIIIFLGAVIRNFIRPDTVDWVETLQISAILLAVMVCIAALGLPALYRFGSEKGRLLMLLILGVGVGAALAVAQVFSQFSLLPSPAVAAGLAVVLIVAVTYVSFRLSVRFYRKRRNGDYDK